LKPAWPILMLVLWCAACRTPPKFSYTSRLGVVVAKSGQPCLAIHNSGLPPDSRIRLVSTSAPQSTTDARTVSRGDKVCASSDTSDPGLDRYSLHLTKDNAASSTPAIAISDFSGSFGKVDNLVFADLEGDGQREFFRACTSAEGVHFTVWSGKPLEGKLRWHQYYYLGYDVDANCTPIELQSPN
jgi:hypothetical protein